MTVWANPTVFVPHYAMSGGTLLALASDEIVMAPHAVLGPVDPQLGQHPAASLLTVVEQKPIAEIDEQTLIEADQARKALTQVEKFVRGLLEQTIGDKAQELAHTLACGTWTHDYPITVGEGVLEVRATNGDTFLGGDDFDQRIIDWIVDEFRKDQGIDLRQDRMALQRLKEAAEKAKIELSSAQTTEINLPFITAGASGPKHLSMSLSRAKLEQLTGDLIDRTKGPVQQALKDAGVEPRSIDEVVLVGGQTRMLAIQQLGRGMFGKEPHKGVNPDEVVAVGAAIQAGVLRGEVRHVLLLDVTPLSLGVETQGGVMTLLIPRNTTIPTSKTETFTTAAGGQTSVEVHVLQGERPMASENKSLGRFILDGILPAPRGVPQIEVTFDIDANGILNVSARDKATGKEQRVVIQPSSGLSEAEIQRMVRDAEAHAAEDARRREEIEVRNQADSAHYQAEKLLREQGANLPEHVRADIAEKSAAVKRALDANDVSGMREATQHLQQAMLAVGQAAYVGTASQAGPGGPDGRSGAETPEGTVEGEYREV